MDAKLVDTVEFRQWTSTDHATLEARILSVDEFLDLLKKLPRCTSQVLHHFQLGTCHSNVLQKYTHINVLHVHEPSINLRRIPLTNSWFKSSRFETVGVQLPLAFFLYVKSTFNRFSAIYLTQNSHYEISLSAHDRL